MNDGNVGGFLCFLFFAVLFNISVGALLGHFLKGRGYEAALWSFLLGCAGWLSVAIMADKRRFCPECRSKIPTDATRCRFCQAQLGAYVPAKSQKSQDLPRPPKAKWCHKCNVAMTGDFEMGQAVFRCPKCGDVKLV